MCAHAQRLRRLTLHRRLSCDDNSMSLTQIKGHVIYDLLASERPTYSMQFLPNSIHQFIRIKQTTFGNVMYYATISSCPRRTVPFVERFKPKRRF